MKRVWVKMVMVIVVAGLLVGVLGGCNGEVKYRDLYGSALMGAGIGAIVGHQSDEAAEGALVGAAVFATGTLLHYVDDYLKETTVTVKVTNSDGSKTPVEFRKKKGVYRGPKGEKFDHLPTEAEIKEGYAY